MGWTDILTPLATVLSGAHLSSSGPTCHGPNIFSLFLFFSSPYLQPLVAAPLHAQPHAVPSTSPDHGATLRMLNRRWWCRVARVMRPWLATAALQEAVYRRRGRGGERCSRWRHGRMPGEEVMWARDGVAKIGDSEDGSRGEVGLTSTRQDPRRGRVSSLTGETTHQIE